MNLEVGLLAVKFLGIVSVASIVGIVLCVLAVLGFNTYIKFQDKNKKIEVCAEDTNSKNDSHGWDFVSLIFILFLLLIFYHKYFIFSIAFVKC